MFLVILIYCRVSPITDIHQRSHRISPMQVALNEEKGQVQSGSVRRGKPSFTLRFPSGERHNVGLERVRDVVVTALENTLGC